MAKAASEAVYDAMVSIAKVPAHDKFQIITRHSADELIYPAEGYLGIEYSPGIILIQITWVSGRTTEVKKAFFKAIADSIHEKANVRREDVLSVLSIPSARIGLSAAVSCSTRPRHKGGNPPARQNTAIN